MLAACAAAADSALAEVVSEEAGDWVWEGEASGEVAASAWAGYPETARPGAVLAKSEMTVAQAKAKKKAESAVEEEEKENSQLLSNSEPYLRTQGCLLDT